MPRFYLASALLALALYGTAQVRGWSVFGSDAVAFQRERAERSEALRGGSRSGGTFGSGHK